MEYISAIEASIKWGVSLRQVQRLLADGRIPRAKKIRKVVDDSGRCGKTYRLAQKEEAAARIAVIRSIVFNRVHHCAYAKQ